MNYFPIFVQVMNDTKQEFDAFSGEYRTLHTKNLKLSGAESSYFCEHKILEIKKQEGDASLRMLDFGCGDGLLSQYFATHFPSGFYTGIDVSSETIKQALLHASGRCSFHHYEGSRFPFADETYDIALAANVFHHIGRKDQSGTLRELSRVLKPGGRLYIFEHNPANPVTRWIVRSCAFDRNAELLLPSRFRRYFRDSGMTWIRTKYLLFFPRHRIFKRFLPLEECLHRVPFGAQYMIIGKKQAQDSS